ncbi:MAG: DNA polymerase III subunit gamma/tau [Chthoniobacterales bacterium]
MSSYQVFARKYRPKTFDDVIGQEHITQTLKNAIEQNRLAHAYLFVGPRGTGKTSTARILAMALNCETGHGKPTTTPCGVCDSCREIAQGNSLDVLEFDAASNTQVDKIREIIIDNVKFAPTKGTYKLYLVDEVHMLSNSSFNALLKTLEEPPSHVKFLFATTDPQKVPVTILSRCQRFDLKRIPDTLIANHLQYIAGEERITLSDAASAAIARGADGGLRDAESMLDQLVAFCGEAIEEEDVLKIFGFTSQETINALTEHILRIETPQALSLVHAQAESGKDLMKVLTDLLGHLRNLLIFQVDPSSLDREISSELRSVLQEQAGFVSGPKLLDLIQQLSAAEGRMKWAANKKLQLEIALIRATQSLQVSSLDDVLAALTSLRDGSPMATSIPLTPPPPRAFTPAPAPSPAPVISPKRVEPKPEPKIEPKPEPVPAAAAPVEAPMEVTQPDAVEVSRTETIAELWPKILREVSSKRRLILSFLELASPELGADDTLSLAFPTDQKFAVENLQRPNNRAFLEDLVTHLRGKTTSLQIALREGATAPTVSYAIPEEPVVDPMEAFKNDPLIKKALELFKAEITSVIPPQVNSN